MEKYFMAEKRLAELLGWQGVWKSDFGLRGIPPGLQDPKHPDHGTIFRHHGVPKWSRDDAAVFCLMVEHADVCAGALTDAVWHHSLGNIGGDVKDAVRLSVVQAVINKLEKT